MIHRDIKPENIMLTAGHRAGRDLRLPVPECVQPRAVYRAVIRRRTRTLAALADRLVDYVRDVVAGGSDPR